MTKPTSFPYLKFIITVVAKRIWTYCYFIRKEQIKVKRANKSRKTVMFVTKIHVYTWYCSFLTLIIILQILGMLSAGFYSRQTPDILPKMPLICCCKIGNDEVWYQISYFSNMVPFYSVSLLVYNVYISVPVIPSISVTNIRKLQYPTILWPRH